MIDQEILKLRSELALEGMESDPNELAIMVLAHILKQAFSKPEANPPQPTILTDLDKVKKLVPDQYDIIIDLVKFVVERVENPAKTQEDRYKIQTFFDSTKLWIKTIREKI